MAALLVLALLRAEPPCEEELCRYALSELKLVAIVSGDADPVAMFENPRGKGFVVRRDSPIGTRGGKVLDIAKDCVVVREGVTKTKVCMERELL